MFFLCIFAEVIKLSELSINADEFVPPNAPVSDIGFDAVQSVNLLEPEPEPCNQPEQINQFESNDFMQHEQPLMAAEQFHEKSVDLLNFSGEPKPELEIPTAQLIESEPEPQIEPQTQPQPQPQPEPVIESSNINEVSDATVGGAAIAVTTAAVAAAAVGVSKLTSAKAKPIDAKKPEAKGKVAPIKKPTTVTSKVTSKLSTAKTDDKPKVTAKATPRTSLTSKVSSTTDKKPISSTTARKPLSNGSKSNATFIYNSVKHISFVNNFTLLSQTFNLNNLIQSWYYIDCPEKDTNNF